MVVSFVFRVDIKNDINVLKIVTKWL